MTEAAVHRALVYGLFVTAVASFVSLWFVTAPYGRHARRGWGPQLPARAAWAVMECPAVLCFVGFYLRGAHRFDAAPLVLLAMWLSHYGYRVFVFPFRLPSGGRPVPLAIAVMAVVFNVCNAYVNARWISALGAYPRAWLYDPRLLVGLALFVGGQRINHRADAILMALRAPGERGYKIPRGFLYRWISCPNYFGEIVEWLGWAVATWSLSGLSFAVYTVANLVPRAVAHHAWYRTQFADYPPERKALIPYVL